MDHFYLVENFPHLIEQNKLHFTRRTQLQFKQVGKKKSILIKQG